MSRITCVAVNDGKKQVISTKKAGKWRALSGVDESLSEGRVYLSRTNSALLFLAQAASSSPWTAGFSFP